MYNSTSSSNPLKRYPQRGFTIIEIIISLSVLAILGTIAFVAMGGFRESALDSKRTTDITNLSSAISNYIQANGIAPEPSNARQVTYSGATIWSQGVLDDSVIKKLGTLEAGVKDPVFSKNYSYSVLNSKKEFQIGAVIQTDEAVSKGSFSDFITWADTTAAVAYVRGNYNGILAKTRSGDVCDTIALPSIILSNLNSLELINASSGALVIDREKNTPAAYEGTPVFYDGQVVFRSFADPQIVLVPTRTCDMSTFSDTTSLQTLATNVQNAYSGTVIAKQEDTLYSKAAESVTTPELKADFGKEIMVNILGENTKIDPGLVGTGCSLQPNIVSGTGYFVGSPTASNQTWIYWDKSNPITQPACSFTCEAQATWNGSICIKTNAFSCTGKPANSFWVGADGYLQTWDMGNNKWDFPDTVATYGAATVGECKYGCIGGFHKNPTLEQCDADSQNCVEPNSRPCAGTQTWNHSSSVWNSCVYSSGSGGYIPSSDKLSCIKNCTAGAQAINAHTYNTATMSGSTSTTVISSPVSVPQICIGNNLTYSQNFSCSQDGLIAPSGAETTSTLSCAGGYTKNLGALTCDPNSGTSACGGIQDIHSTNNSIGSSTNFSQIWNCAGWNPLGKSWTRSATAGSECTFECNTGYTWNGTTCAPNSCNLPWGGNISSSSSVTAYQTSNVPFGSTCTGETRTCNLGVLSGSFTNSLCTVTSATDCNASTQTVNGHTYSVGAFNHGNTTSVNSASVPTTITCAGNTITYRQTFSCFNGVVSTSGGETTNIAACSVNYTPSANLCIANANNNVSCGAQPANSTPTAGTTYNQTWNCSGWSPILSWTNGGGTCGFTCNSGYTWNGSSCAPNGCNLPWGGTITDGQSVTAYASSSANCGSSCSSQTRICSLGVLSGSYTASNCSVLPCPVCGSNSACITGNASGDDWNSTCNTTRHWSCTSGGVTDSSCNTVNRACNACNLPWGGTTPHNTTVTAYSSASVACGSSCASQGRYCNDGSLGGSYTNQSCVAATCPACYSNADCQEKPTDNTCTTDICVNPGTAGAYCTNSLNPVNGGWSDWGAWSGCVDFSKSHSRTCTNPTPSCGGAGCSGLVTESTSCGTYTCHCTMNPTYEGGPCYPYGLYSDCGYGGESFCAGAPCDDGNACTTGDTLSWNNSTCSQECVGIDVDPIGTWETSEVWTPRGSYPFGYDVSNIRTCHASGTCAPHCMNGGVSYPNGYVLNEGSVAWCPCTRDMRGWCHNSGRSAIRCTSDVEMFPTPGCYQNISNINVCYGESGMY